METAQKIAHNTLWQILGKIVGTALGVATIGLLTRYLGTTGYGYYSTAVAFMQFFGVLVDMGLYLICLKEISAKPQDESKIISNFFTLRFFSALIFLGGGCLLIFLFPYPPIVKWSALIVSGSFYFMSLVQIITAPFQTRLKMGLVALAECLGRLIFLITVIIFIYYGGGLPWLMFSNVANTLGYFLLLLLIYRRLIKLAWAFDFIYWQTILKQAWPIALGIAFNLVYFRADTVILSLYHAPGVVGLYSAPYRILEILATFPHMFMGLVMPLLTAAWINNNREQFQKILQNTFNFFLILIVPLVLGTLPLATKVMTLIAGPDFSASGPILSILMLATGIIFIGIIFTYLIVILDKQKAMLKYFFAAAILSLISYFIFIPRYSYWGAAWVTVLVEGFIVLTSWLLFWQVAKTGISFKIFWKALFCSLIMMLMLYWLINLNTLLLILLGVLIYAFTMILIHGIDRRFLAEILKINKS